MAVQKAAGGKEINWIIETKGRIFESLVYKEASIKEWCSKVSKQFGQEWRYIRVDQSVSKPDQYKTFSDLLRAIESREDATPLLT